MDRKRFYFLLAFLLLSGSFLAGHNALARASVSELSGEQTQRATIAREHRQ